MKKYIKYQLVSVLAFFLIMFNACTDNYEELNTRNSLVTEDIIDEDLLFTRVEVQAIHFGSTSNTTGNGVLTVREDNVPFTTGDAPGVWNSGYGNYCRNLADIVNLCKKRNEANNNNALDNKIAISRILKAWAYSEITDTYGDVPYFETCLPVDKAVLQPKYDTQKSIYEDLFKELKEAAAQLDPGKESFGSADLIYKGDVAKWKKLANSIRLRLALRVRYADRAMAEANMSDLTEANLITTSADDAFILSADDYSENMNAIYTNMINSGQPHTSHMVSKTLVDILIGSGDAHHPIDPRLKIYADTAYAQWVGKPGYENISSFGYRGRPLLGDVTVKEKYPWGADTSSKLAAFWYAPVIERPLISSSEVNFDLAEAVLAGLKSGNANTYYQKGIDEAFVRIKRIYDRSKPQMPAYLRTFYSKVYPEWDATWEADYFADKEIKQSEIDALKADAVYTLSGSTENQLEMIMNQKVISMYPDESQAWFEWLRTGYPRIMVGHRPSNNTMNEAPRRMPWPQIEQSVNSDNYEEALARQGADTRLTRIWWDANTAAPHEHPGTVPSMDEPWVTTGK